MKKIVAVATALTGALTLAACGGGADDPTEAEIDEATVESVMPDAGAGTYTGSTPDGDELVLSMAADGTYTVSVAGEQTETGTWENNIRGTCLTAEGDDGEACWNIMPGEEEGMVDITGPDGETRSFSFEA